MNPAFVEINVIANDDINGIPVKIPRLFDCANKCETDKWGNYTTKQGGLVRILSSEYSLLEAKLKYTPPVGFMGMDSIDYKITTEGGLTDIAKVIFVVTDGVQEPPTNITSAPASLSIDENLSAGTNIGSFTATDANGGPHVFTLVSGTGSTDNYNLSLTSGGILSSAAVFNAENKTSLSIRVRATDPFTFYYEEVFTITVNDLNEYPVYITSNGGGATANISVAENSTAVTTVTSSDADADDVPVYSITGGADAGSFSINGASGVLTFGSAPDFETPSDTGANNVYEVTVQVSDGTYTDSQTISVTVTNVNEAPVITEGGNVAVSMSVDGNPTPFSLTLNATDVDAGTTLTWSISSAASHGTASASGTGTSKVISYTPDALYAGPDSFTVQVSDGSGGTDTIVVNVTVGP
jgi:serralysin